LRNVAADAMWEGNDGMSLVAFGTILLRSRRSIVAWTLFGGVVAAVVLLLKPAEYRASASFIPEQTDAARSGLASLAGQFAISLPTGGETVSPDFYSSLLKSRVILSRIAEDTFVVAEAENRRIAFGDLFDVGKGSPARREVASLKLLDDIVTTTVAKATGIVRLSVVTKWPSVSYAIAKTLVEGVDLFNRRTRQGRATSERTFIEGRLAAATADLRGAEDVLEHFLINNRQFASSPELVFQHDRLQREVAVRQQVVNTLTQSYEEVRIREVRDTPLITVLEPPALPAVPEPRGRLTRLVFGLFAGGLVGSVLALISASMARRDAAGDPEVKDLMSTLRELRPRVSRRGASVE
jgi:uncharacterized protein involved in exopolysaccharide biosynthesis